MAHRPIPKLFDPICQRLPDQIEEYRECADAEGCTPDEYVWREEGTLDADTGQFLCTDCYLAHGSPAGRVGLEPRWTATPQNIQKLLASRS